MNRRPSVPALLATTLALACASATERLEQGIELEADGRWPEAAARYVDALEKDNTLREARTRLRVAADSAVAQGVREAEAEGARGNPVAAGEVYLALDQLMERTRGVGVTPARPDGYAQLRREAFDGAITALMRFGAQAARGGRWSEGRAAYQRIHRDFQPDPAQERAAVEAEADHVVAWAEAELAAGRYRNALELTEEVLEFGIPIPDPTAEIAARLRALALDRGTRFLVVLPVSHETEVGAIDAREMALQLADILELEFWRDPPLFLRVADPVEVRRLVRRGGRWELSPRNVRALLEDLGGDLVASIELVSVTRSESDVRSSSRRTRTRDGRTVTYRIEEGSVRYEGLANVILLDQRGIEVAGFDVRRANSGGFRRGVYEGDAGELSLGRNEARLFDPDVVAEQLRVVRDGMIEALARELGPRVFDRALSRVP